MNWILKNKNKSSKALLVVFFLLFSFGIFGIKNNISYAANDEICPEGTTNAYKAPSDCQCYDNDNKAIGGVIKAGTDIGVDGDGIKITTFCSLNSCIQQCQKISAPKAALIGTNGNPINGSPSSASGKLGNSEVGKAPTIKEAVGGVFTEAIKYVLTEIQTAVGWLFAMSATLFAWVVDPANISGENGLLNKQAVKDVWIMVRDLLNMTFILILLFAAFCTIFQVEKWALKKVWLNILINALLVNFSYPIARFFIDVSNVAFYYFVNNLFTATGTTVVTGSSIMASFGSASNIASILRPSDFSTSPIAYQIAIIIVIFIMGMTFLIVAALFVVRLIALTMLVMFSPIGFVGYIFPATASFADDWWKKLFKYSFFAPIMIFIMAISLKIMEALRVENFSSISSYASANTPAGQTNFIATAAFYTIPIIILWMGMGIAQSMGIAGADKVVGAVKKGGKWLASNPALGMGGYAWKKSGAPGGIKKGWEDVRKSGKIFGKENWATRLAFKDEQPGREARIAGGVSGGKEGWNSAIAKMKAKEFNEKVNEQKDGHTGISMNDVVDPATGNVISKGLHTQINETVNANNALKIAAMHRHMMSDPGRVSEFENMIKNNINNDATHQATMAALANDQQREAYMKVQVQNGFAEARHQAQLAKEQYTTGVQSSPAFQPTAYVPPIAPAPAPITPAPPAPRRAPVPARRRRP
ncbi:MAG: hypothetical protein PHP62_02950 [Candidatus Moranbacteria bacterium]|nr:hypothetical protein [Candidatus Moranbacteria bacterium]